MFPVCREVVFVVSKHVDSIQGLLFLAKLYYILLGVFPSNSGRGDIFGKYSGRGNIEVVTKVVDFDV